MRGSGPTRAFERLSDRPFRMPVAASLQRTDQTLQLTIGFALRFRQLIEHLHARENELANGSNLAIVFG
jgi:hypothetical protein